MIQLHSNLQTLKAPDRDVPVPGRFSDRVLLTTTTTVQSLVAFLDVELNIVTTF
ncbi:unnamed protein product, partial [Nesidiocoris tenuis]